MNKLILILVLFLFMRFSSAQDSKGFSMGVNAFSNGSVEFGYDVMYVFGNYNWYHSYRLASEIQCFSKLLVAPKFSARVHNFNTGIVLGVEFLNYSNFRMFNNVLRPSIGLSLLGLIDLSYGYNFKIDNNALLPINTHNIEVIYRPFVGKALGGITAKKHKQSVVCNLF